MTKVYHSGYTLTRSFLRARPKGHALRYAQSGIQSNEQIHFLGKEILKLMFSIPCIFSLLVSALYNIVGQVFNGFYFDFPLRKEPVTELPLPGYWSTVF